MSFIKITNGKGVVISIPESSYYSHAHYYTDFTILEEKVNDEKPVVKKAEEKTTAKKQNNKVKNKEEVKDEPEQENERDESEISGESEPKA